MRRSSAEKIMRVTTMAAQITNNFHKPVAAPPETTYAALTSLETFQPFQEALSALGIGDRLVSLRTSELDSGSPRLSVSRLIWRLAGGGRAEIAWLASVKGDGDGGSILSVAVRAGANEEASREEFRAAWPLLGSLVKLHVRHALTAVCQLAEHLDSEGERASATPLRAVV